MTVSSVWGLIDGAEEIAVYTEGDTWIFGSLPLSKTGEVIVEVWAEDDAGNQDYRAAVLTIEKGAIKCFRWVTEYGRCTMRPVGRTCEMAEFRPLCTMRPHVCPKEVC